ncbi:MAG: hypothetical protein QME81_09030 [bacterium]|nr:hypothetical protein [bacterium]
MKYQKATDFRDLKTIHKLGFKRGLLISRDRLERMDEYWIVPLELFLLYLEEFLEAGN